MLAAATAPTLPKLLVFDLDHTLWTPELYTLRRLPGYQTAAPPGPVADADVSLFPGAAAVLEAVATEPRWQNTKCACASRTNKGPWARSLLAQFEAGGKSLDELMAYQEIYTGGKAKHFEALRDKSGVAYEDMLFFDDARDGKYGNCARVAELGCVAVHTPRGLDPERFAAGLAAHAAGARGAAADAAAPPRPPAGAAATVPCVSLAMPFAALLLNGAKTIETRNSRLFAPYAGKMLAIRVGKKDWDSEDWKEVHAAPKGELKRGFKRGDVAGYCRIGATRPLETFEHVLRLSLIHI